MTRISRVQRLASLRLSANSFPSPRTTFPTTRNLSTTQCLRADEPPTQDEAAYIENATERASRLRLPPKQTIADTEAEISAADHSYTPATFLADLEPLPQMKSWWHQPGHWGPESQFSGFGVGAKQRITNPSLVKVMLKRAVLEVQALQQTGQYDALKFKKWSVGGAEDLQRVMKGDLTAEESTAIVDSLTAEEHADGASAPVVPTLEEAEDAINSWDADWLSTVIDEETKFVIRKRLYQLTGTLLPDAKLAAAKTVRDIATFASVAPKPKKLHQVLRAETQSLPPNLKIHGRRITPIDREKAVGRWKIIEEELKKRDLPVTGHGDVASHREKVWLLGKR